MIEFEGFGADGEPVRLMPCIELECEVGKLALTYLNTRIRLFEDESFNHVEHKTDELGTLGMRPTDELLELLFERNFPMAYDPVVDQATMEWFVALQVSHLGEEIDGLLD